MQPNLNQGSRNIYSVSKLTRHIKSLLEQNYGIIWLSGEISNLSTPSSGHAYFTLKDEKSQISAVIFKGQLRRLKFKLKSGANIIGLGRISVYEPRGTYQIILEYIEPHGAGALQIAFEQLKQKLDQEGLFHPSQKKEIPFLPEKIGVITSPTGAVIKDIFQVVARRYPGMDIDLFPVKVQGHDAIADINRAIETANTDSKCNVIILARGGGSFEDMAAFNSEDVARAIFKSTKPVISAVGHETDFSIADFVADLRAPTPSAAAELAVPLKNELKARCGELLQRSSRVLLRMIEFYRSSIEQFDKTMPRLSRRLQDQQLKSDDLVGRLSRAAIFYKERQGTRFKELNRVLLTNNPKKYISILKAKHELLLNQITQNIQQKYTYNQESLKTLHTALNALNPKAILKRGYSITRTLPQKDIVSDPNQVEINDFLEIQLAKGSIEVTVHHKPPKRIIED